MQDWLRFRPETNDVRLVLVRELATGVVPAAIMSVTLLSVGLFAAYTLNSRLLLTTTAIGGIFTIAKLRLMFRHRRQDQSERWDLSAAGRWQRAYASVNLGVATAVSIVAGATFAAPNVPLQMLATGMLFGYCSGIVARLSIRPRIALAVLSTAAVPVIFAAALHGGSAYWILSTIFAVFLLGSFESVRHVHDVAVHQIAMRLDMATIARNDPLTGLKNRLGLREAFLETTSRERQSAMMAVHCLDLDGFKPVNDRYGHPAGDALLKALSGRVASVLRQTDFAARIGGDEFVVVQFPLQHADEAEMFARRLTRAITSPYEIEGQTIHVGVSLGYTTSPPEVRNLDELLATADAALYRMKRCGGGIAGMIQGAAVA